MILQSTESVKYITETCCKCGVRFAMDADFQAAAKREKSTWYCPQGHPQAYIESALQKAQGELEELKQRHNACDDALNFSRSRIVALLKQIKGLQTKIKRLKK